MTPDSYSVLAASVFAIVAILQLVRAVKGWKVTIGSTDIPVGVSWVAFIVAGLLTLLGFTVASR